MAETTIKSVVHAQTKQLNTNIYYCSTKVLTGRNVQFKNINKNLYHYTAAVYAPNITIDPEDLKAIINYGGNVNFGSGAVSVLPEPETVLSVSVPVRQAVRTKLQKTEWTAYVKVWSSYTLDFDPVSTIDFFRLNSNIYKNIFNHIIFDLELIQDKKEKQPKPQVFSFEQYFDDLELYDIIYMDDNGVYKKAIANRECYDAIGIIININNGIYTVMSSGILDNDFNIKSSISGILYLSDADPGKFVTYEEINSMFYKPIGFFNNNKIIISICDASEGNVLEPYDNNIFNISFGHYSKYDLDSIVQEVLDNA